MPEATEWKNIHQDSSGANDYRARARIVGQDSDSSGHDKLPRGPTRAGRRCGPGADAITERCRTFLPASSGHADILIAGAQDRADRPWRDPASGSCTPTSSRWAGCSPFPVSSTATCTSPAAAAKAATPRARPSWQLSDAARGGVTTVVGCLGTDGVTRSLANLLAKARGLERGHHRVHLHGLLRRARPHDHRQHRAGSPADRQGDRRGRGGPVGSPLDTAHVRGVRAAGGRGPARGHPVGQGGRGERAHG